jgi:exodeoxyribonuclease VII small subunit
MAKTQFSFNTSIAEIEEILKNIEDGEPDIDKLAAKVKRAAELIKLCQKKLRETEEEIDTVFKDI